MQFEQLMELDCAIEAVEAEISDQLEFMQNTNPTTCKKIAIYIGQLKKNLNSMQESKTEILISKGL